MKKSIFSRVATIALCTALVTLANGSASEAPTSISVFNLPQNIGATVNSGNNQNNVSIAPTGLSLYFSSDRPGFGSLDIWVSQRPTQTAAWGTPQNLGAVINTSSNENLPSLSADGKTMFFSCSCPDAVGATDIYMTTRTDVNNDFGWTAPVNLGAVINTDAGEIAPGYFEDPATGNAVLYFTSNRAGSEDIYQSTRNPNGTFNAPTNVAALNTTALDRGVSVRRDGLEIFISSDRDGSLGGRDIWVATRASVTAAWNPPVNLAGVNSSGTEQSPSISTDGSILYLVSSRDGLLNIYTAARVSVNRTSTADFDGDGRTDLSVFRPTDGIWYVVESGTNTFRAQQFGANGDRVVPGDYDGDGRTDIAVFRPTDRNWYISRSSDGAVSITTWGLATDRPVPGDYDGDGRTDIAVYRNGTWYAIQSSNGQPQNHQFGLPSDVPIAGSAQ
ncbi:MAG: PD40 domain-containing protein [Pyrinomonadaceae bacterium]|nr:PD40 domain-containing protein [Pyrinomonadaceae bacterium]